MFRLAGHLKMTVRELCERMDSREFAEWKAYAKYFEPFGDEWRQAALIITAVIAPYCSKGRFPKPTDFMPLAELPQTPEELAAEIRKMAEMQGGITEWHSQGGEETP